MEIESNVDSYKSVSERKIILIIDYKSWQIYKLSTRLNFITICSDGVIHMFTD